MWRIIASAILVVTIASNAIAEDCQSLKEPTKVLKCYDDLNSGRSLPGSAAAAKGPADRGIYANNLRKVFLSNGIDFDVMWPEKSATGKDNKLIKYPRLIIFGYMNQATVYQLITQGKVLKNAKDVGFNFVEFSTKGSGGVWWWDISGPSPPPCDLSKRLCL